MARVDLRCSSCGYMFFVNELQYSQGVKCPSCLAPVGIQGPSAEGPRRKTVRVLTTVASDPSVQRLRQILAVLVVSAVVVIGIVVTLVLSLGGTSAPPEAPKPRPFRTGPGVSDSPGAGPAQRPNPGVRQDPSSGTLGGKSPETPAPVVNAPTPPPQRPLTASATPGVPESPVTAPPAVDALPADLVQKIRSDVLSLPGFYRDLVLSAPERARLEGLLGLGKGTVEDAGFLRGLVSGAKLKVVRDEIDSVGETYLSLEKDALEGLPLDKVVLKDKRVRSVRIIEETPEMVRVSQKMAGGVSGEQKIRVEEIELIQKGKGVGAEFKARWEAAQKADVLSKIELLNWCKENALTLQAKLVCYHVLRIEPGHPVCRAEAGLAPDPVQVVVRATAEGGSVVSYLGRSWTPRELKEKLIRDGYVLLGGEWYARKERMISVPGLFRYEKQSDKPVQISAIGQMSLTHDTEITYRTVQDVQAGSFSEQPELKYTRRYYGPTLSVRTITGGTSRVLDMETRTENDVAEPPAGRTLEGEVTISVPLSQPILDASVMMASEVHGSGAITVYLVLDGDRKLLYRSTGKDQESHKLPETVRGRNSIELVAVISTPASYIPKLEKRRVKSPVRSQRGLVISPGLEVVHNRLIPDAQAVLFPSNSNTIEVFRLTVNVGEPAAALNAVFARAGASNVLKQ